MLLLNSQLDKNGAVNQKNKVTMLKCTLYTMCSHGKERRK